MDPCWSLIWVRIHNTSLTVLITGILNFSRYRYISRFFEWKKRILGVYGRDFVPRPICRPGEPLTLTSARDTNQEIITVSDPTYRNNLYFTVSLIFIDIRFFQRHSALKFFSQLKQRSPSILSSTLLHIVLKMLRFKKGFRFSSLVSSLKPHVKWIT